MTWASTTDETANTTQTIAAMMRGRGVSRKSIAMAPASAADNMQMTKRTDKTTVLIVCFLFCHLHTNDRHPRVAVGVQFVYALAGLVSCLCDAGCEHGTNQPLLGVMLTYHSDIPDTQIRGCAFAVLHPRLVN